MRAVACFIAFVSLAAGQVRLPEYTRDVLPNGVVLDVSPRRGVPLVSVQVIVRGGGESDPDGKGGLASVTADLLRRGTAKRTAAQFSEELDFMGADFYTHADPQATFVTLRFLAKDTERALDLLADALFRPSFPEAEVKKAMAERIEQAKGLKDEPGAAAASYFRTFFFGAAHPYGHRLDGDELSLARLARTDVVRYHSRHYAGRNLIVAASGDFDGPAMRERLTRILGEVPAGTAYEWRKAPTVRNSGSPRLLLVDKPGMSQTYFWIGNPGIARTSPDRVPVWIVDTLFGGRFTSMLNDELRVNSGLTYGANSRVDEDRLAGRVALFSYTRTEDTVKAIDLALNVVKRLREQGITDAQLASAKAYVKGIFPTERLETSGQIAGILGELELFGLGRDEVDGLFARIDAVTLEQANAAAQQHFGAGPMVFVLVGDAAKIRESVRKYAPALIETSMSKPGFDAAVSTGAN